MIKFSDKYRSDQVEIMDDVEFRGREMERLLKDLKRINKWLGGNQITIDGIRKLLVQHPKNETVVILDIGCGDGELLRECAKYAKKNNIKLKGIGLDFNNNILDFAAEQSKAHPNIEFKKINVFSKENPIPNCDIALSTLFLHHFEDVEIIDLINKVMKKTRLGWVINDLHRSRIAFNLFKFISFFFIKSNTAKHDGLVSIAKGFKKRELIDISRAIPNQRSIIRWRWAFRYQWILKRTP
ncbi:MAG: methyltransferase domain-containing protein [Aequorivita sp.]